MRRIKSFFKSISSLYKIILFLSIVFILCGTSLIIYSLKHEVLDEKYIITEINETQEEEKELSDGEISVIGNTKYIKNGIFKVTLNTYTKQIENKNPLKENSILTITDYIGEGYEQLKEKVIINEKEYSYNEKIISDEKIRFEYENNFIFITIPNNIANKENTISFYIKLTSRELNKKQNTTIDSYYSFEPSENNNFYEKKGYQSYIISDDSYIKLAKK